MAANPRPPPPGVPGHLENRVGGGTPPDEQRPPHEFEHKRGEQKEGEQKASSHPVNAAPFVDPSLYDDEVLHRTAPHGLTGRLRSKQLTVRDLTQEELSMAFAWMWQDEQETVALQWIQLMYGGN